MDPDRFTDTNPDPVDADDPLNVVYKNPALANQTIDVELDDGAGDTKTHQLQLDANGRGEFAFTIPAGWAIVNLNAVGSSERTVSVNP